MTTHQHDDPEAILRQLRQQFVDGFERQCDRLGAAIAGSDAGTAGAREELRHLLHRMAGLSGTLGLARVSTQAADLEGALEHDPVARGPLTAAVARLQAALREDLADPAQ